MPSVKTRKMISTGVVLLLWLGVVGFLGIGLLPLLQEVRSLHRDVESGRDILAGRNRADLIPSRALVAEHAELKSRLEQEAQRCASFYLSRSGVLDRRILRSFNRDEIEVAEEYFKLKKRLAYKANNPDFVEMEWESKGTPPKDKLRDVEKRACIVEVLVDVLTAQRTTPATVIESMRVDPPQSPRGVPSLPSVDWRVTRYRAYPVSVTFTTSFRSLGRILDDSLIDRRTAAGGPALWTFMAIRSIEVKPLGARKPGQVRVKLGLQVYDFREA